MKKIRKVTGRFETRKELERHVLSEVAKRPKQKPTFQLYSERFGIGKSALQRLYHLPRNKVMHMLECNVVVVPGVKNQLRYRLKVWDTMHRERSRWKSYQQIADECIISLTALTEILRDHGKKPPIRVGLYKNRKGA